MLSVIDLEKAEGILNEMDEKLSGRKTTERLNEIEKEIKDLCIMLDKGLETTFVKDYVTFICGKDYIYRGSKLRKVVAFLSNVVVDLKEIQRNESIAE